MADAESNRPQTPHDAADSAGAASSSTGPQSTPRLSPHADTAKHEQQQQSAAFSAGHASAAGSGALAGPPAAAAAKHDEGEQQQSLAPTTAAVPCAGGTGLLPSSNLGETGEAWQLLRLECMSQAETRRLLGCLDVAFRASLAAFVAFLVLRFQLLPDGRAFFCTTMLSAVNLGFAALLLPVTAATAGWSLFRFVDSALCRKKWSGRRRRLAVMYGIQLAAATVGLTAYLVTNAIVVSPASCSSSTTRNAIYWLAFVRWTAWNTTFLMITVRAHATTIVLPKAASAGRWQLFKLAVGLPAAVSGVAHGSRSTTAPSGSSGSRQLRPNDGGSKTGSGRERIIGSPGSGGFSAAKPAHGFGATAPVPEAPAAEAALHAAAGRRHSSSHSSSGKRRSRQKRPDMLTLDLPVIYHWPKLLCWLAFEACHLALAVFESQASTGGCWSLAETCDLLPCFPPPRVIGLLSGEVAIALLYYGIWCWLMLRSGRLLRTRPWQEFRVANMLFRLERRLGIWAYTLIVVCSIIFWFGSLADCSRAAFQYHGLPSTEMMWAVISVIGALITQPHSPHQANPQLVVQLQEFAWTERELEQRIKARNAAAAGLDKEPMFCFESAVKLFFWSCLVYEEYDGVQRSREHQGDGSAAVMPPGTAIPEEQLEQLMKAMALYGCSVHKVVYDTDGELKVLFAWSPDTVVVAFRGSTTAANWAADAMMWRTAHPGAELKAQKSGWFNSPKIHSGFSRCWSGTGLDVKILGMLSSLVDTSLDRKRLKLYFTGHSLGGAIATLAAFDLLKKYPDLDARRQVSVYTFGAPRVGNHPWARQYEEVVPDTWHVINDQDTIPRGGKFLHSYKRNGQRVIVNTAGDLVVRPAPLESSLLQMALGSNPLHHLLASYQAALTSVALGQLDQLKSLPGGAEGLLALVKECPIMAESMYRYGNAQNLITWMGGRVWYTLGSRAPTSLNKLAAQAAHLATTGDVTPSKAARQAAGRRRRKRRDVMKAAQLQAARQARRGAAGPPAGDVESGPGGSSSDAQQARPHSDEEASDDDLYSLRGSSAASAAASAAAAAAAAVGGGLGRALSGGLALAEAGAGALWRALTLQQQQQGSQLAAPWQHPQQQQHDVESGVPEGAAAPAAAGDSGGAAQGVAVPAAAATDAQPSGDFFAEMAVEQLKEAQAAAASHRLDGDVPGPLSGFVGFVTGTTSAAAPAAPAAPQPQPLLQQQDEQLKQAVVAHAVPAAAAATAGGGGDAGAAAGGVGGNGQAALDRYFQQHHLPETQAASAACAGAESAGPTAAAPIHADKEAAAAVGAAAAPAATAGAAARPINASNASSSSSPFAAAASAAAAPSSSSSPFSAAAALAADPAPVAAAAAAVAAASSGAVEVALAVAGSGDDRLGSAASLALALDRLDFEDPALARRPSLLLQPAHTAPQALLNPDSVLAGVRHQDDATEAGSSVTGFVADVASRLGLGGGGSSSAGAGTGTAADGSSSGSAAAAAGPTGSSAASRDTGSAASSSRKSGQGRIRTGFRGVMGLLGLKGPGHSNAGTLADSGEAADDRAATTGSRTHDSGDAAAERVLISLGVRRLSLPAMGDAVGAAAAGVVQTRVHELPVVAEEQSSEESSDEAAAA